MNREQSEQQPNETDGSRANGNGANGHAKNGHTSTECPTGKKHFASRAEAERLEAENRKLFPNQSRQYAYKCEQCPAYHLTSKPPDAYAIQKTNLKRLESLATTDVPVTGSANRRGRGETEADVKRLWERGLSDAEIAAQIGITHAGVCHHRKKFGMANKRGERNSPLRLPKSPVTLVECDEQKRLIDEEYQSSFAVLCWARMFSSSRLDLSRFVPIGTAPVTPANSI